MIRTALSILFVVNSAVSFAECANNRCSRVQPAKKIVLANGNIGILTPDGMVVDGGNSFVGGPVQPPVGPVGQPVAGQSTVFVTEEAFLDGTDLLVKTKTGSYSRLYQNGNGYTFADGSPVSEEQIRGYMKKAGSPAQITGRSLSNPGQSSPIVFSKPDTEKKTTAGVDKAPAESEAAEDDAVPDGDAESKTSELDSLFEEEGESAKTDGSETKLWDRLAKAFNAFSLENTPRDVEETSDDEGPELRGPRGERPSDVSHQEARREF